MFVLSFANFNLARYLATPSGDHVMPRAEVHARAQASHGNITVLSHLNINYTQTNTLDCDWFSACLFI